MKTKIEQKLQSLTAEIETLYAERQTMYKRDTEVQVRIHQLVGAIYELQQLIVDPGHQPAVAPERPFWDSDLEDQGSRPSVSDDRDSRPVL